MKKSILILAVGALAVVSCKKTEATVSDVNDSSAVVVGDSAAVIVDNDSLPLTTDSVGTAVGNGVENAVDATGEAIKDGANAVGDAAKDATDGDGDITK